MGKVLVSFIFLSKNKGMRFKLAEINKK